MQCNIYKTLYIYVTVLSLYVFCCIIINTHPLIPPGQDLVPEPEIQVQEAVQKRRGSPGAQPQRQRLHGLQLPALPRGVGEQHPAEHPDQQTSGPAADAQLVAAIPGGL